MDEILKELENEKKENEGLKKENEILLTITKSSSSSCSSSSSNNECKKCKQYENIINELKKQLLDSTSSSTTTIPSTPPQSSTSLLTKSYSNFILQTAPQLTRSISTLPSSLSNTRLLSSQSRNSIESNSRNLVIFNLQERVKRLKEELKEIQNRHANEIASLSDSLNLLMDTDIARLKFENDRKIEAIENKHIRDINMLNEYQEKNIKILIKEKDEEIKRLKKEIGKEIRDEIRSELKVRKASLSKMFNFGNSKRKSVKVSKELEDAMKKLFM